VKRNEEVPQTVKSSRPQFGSWWWAGLVLGVLFFVVAVVWVP
jgi:hypothetical protein